jgi:hypothetical protein
MHKTYRPKYHNSKTRKNKLPFPYRQFYSLEKRLFKINGKVFENTITETKNNIMHKKGYLYGKKINKTKKINI